MDNSVNKNSLLTKRKESMKKAFGIINYMTRKVLITGAGGYIGSIAASLFLESGYSIIALDDFSTGFRQPLEQLQQKFGEEKVHIHQADLKNENEIEQLLQKEQGIETVIHFAGSCSVNESMQNPEKYFSNNTFASLNLLESMTNHHVSRIIFSSSCTVYGEAEKIPLDESHPTRPTNPYGESKRMTEKIIEWYSKLHSLQFVILRYFNVCGATKDGSIGDSKKPSVHLVQNAVRGALGLEDFQLTCPEVDTPDKTPIRDYVDVVDLGRAHILAAQYLEKGGTSQIINLGTGKGNSVLEIVKTVEKVTGVSLPLQKATPRQGEYARMVASNKKAQEILGWQPERTLEESIQSLLQWYRNHPNGWER